MRVVAPPVHAVGVDDLEEGVHRLGHGYAALIERRLDALGVPVVGSLEAPCGLVHPPRLGCNDAGERLGERLYTPQASTGKVGRLHTSVS